MRLRAPVDFDPQADLAAIAQLAAAWRSQFRPAPVSYTPSHLLAKLSALEGAELFRLYLVTNPREPLALAIIAGLNSHDVIDLLALCPSGGEDLVRPFSTTPSQRRSMLAQAPEEASGRGVFAFLLGGEGGAAWLDLEPEGLVLAMARWGDKNVLDPGPLLAARLRRLGERIRALAAPEEEGV